MGATHGGRAHGPMDGGPEGLPLPLPQHLEGREPPPKPHLIAIATKAPAADLRPTRVPWSFLWSFTTELLNGRRESPRRLKQFSSPPLPQSASNRQPSATTATRGLGRDHSSGCNYL